ncbi:MAG: hypothetical protein ACK4SA_04165, partial [Caldilinea sp.]
MQPNWGEAHMDNLQRFWSTATSRNLGADSFRRKRIALPLLLLLSLGSVGITVLSGPEVNFTAGYFLVVAVAAYILGSGWGAIAAVAMLATQLLVYTGVWSVASPQLIMTTLLNSGIIYAITIAMFVVVHDVNRLREENLRLRTLRQTMVTVND